MTVTAARKYHRYEPRGTQAKLFDINASEVLLSGPAGTGKSRACLEKLHTFCLTFPRMRGLIVRKTAESLTNTALQTFVTYVIKEAAQRPEPTVEWYGGSKAEPAAFKYVNGSTINVGGMKDQAQSDKIMSSEYDMIYVQEATELVEDDWEKLTTRLRNRVAPIQQLLADCNPSTPTHWLKIRCDQGKTLMLNTSHEENPIFFNEQGKLTEAGHDYITKLDNLTGVMYMRLRKGIWAAAEGIIYADWNPAVHLVEPFAVPGSWRRWWSVDFGYTNPFCWQHWAEDPDGKLYLIQEIYKTKTLVEDHARYVLQVTQGHPRPQSIFADHDAEGRSTFEKYVGQGTRAAKKDVMEGIEAVQVRMKQRRIHIFRGARVHSADPNLLDTKKPTCTAEEIPGYIWHMRSTPAGITTVKEGPVKENDHGADALRYLVAGVDLVGGVRVRFL